LFKDVLPLPGESFSEEPANQSTASR